MDSDDDTLPDLVLPPPRTQKRPPPNTQKRPSRAKKKPKKFVSSDDEIEFDFGAHDRRTNSSHDDSDVSSCSPRGIDRFMKSTFLF